MSVWFTLKEGLKGFKRARLATVITTTSVSFALLLIGYFLIISLNIDLWIGDFRSRIELEVFLEPDLDKAAGLKIKNEISKIAGVESGQYFSKEQAAKRFEAEFGQSVYDVLDTNPLPSSLTVKIKKDYRTARNVSKITSTIRKISGVSDIVYQKELLAVIDHYLYLLYLIAGGLGLILVTIALILLFNTIRLTIFARKDIIEIMQLVGARRSFIRRPFIIEGFIQGLIGALLANGMLFGSVKMVRAFFYPYLAHSIQIYVFIGIFGVLIGIISSKLSVSKFLKDSFV